MGDKGGKKDKSKHQNQHDKKQQDKVEGTPKKQQQTPGPFGRP